MRFSHGERVVVDHNALATRARLRRVLFMNIRFVTLGKNDKTQVRHDGGTSMTIDRVQHLELDPGSFYGWQSNDSIISITNTDNCHIAESAFMPTTVIKLLLLENITSLTVDPGAFQATIEEVILRNVTITTCRHDAFGGQIGRLFLHSAKINSMENGCVNAQHAWNVLTVTSSRLGHISRSGILGTISDVSIVGCDIASVGGGGIQLNVSRFSMKTTAIGDLGSDGMEVQADQSISLQKCSITRLRRNAFRGLRVVSGAVHGIIINSLSVEHADEGFLKFADGVSVTLHELLFNVHIVCSMNLHEQLRSVSVESAWQPALEDNNSSNSLHTFFQQLFSCDQEPVPKLSTARLPGTEQSEVLAAVPNVDTSSRPDQENSRESSFHDRPTGSPGGESRVQAAWSSGKTISRPGEERFRVQGAVSNEYTTSRPGAEEPNGRVGSPNDDTTSRPRAEEPRDHVPNPNDETTSRLGAKDSRDQVPSRNDESSSPGAEESRHQVPSRNDETTSRPDGEEYGASAAVATTRHPGEEEPWDQTTSNNDRTTSHSVTEESTAHVPIDGKTSRTEVDESKYQEPGPNDNMTSRTGTERSRDHVSSPNDGTTSRPGVEESGVEAAGSNYNRTSRPGTEKSRDQQPSPSRPGTEESRGQVPSPTDGTTNRLDSEESRVRGPGPTDATISRPDAEDSQTPPLVLGLAWTVVAVLLLAWTVLMIVVYRRRLARRRREGSESERQALSDHGIDDGSGPTKERRPVGSVTFTVGGSVGPDCCQVVLSTGPKPDAGTASCAQAMVDRTNVQKLQAPGQQVTGPAGKIPVFGQVSEDKSAAIKNYETDETSGPA